MIQRAQLPLQANIIDVGSGSSPLVDGLLDKGYQHVTVLDIANEALTFSRQRLGEPADQVEWLEADITSVDLPARYYDLWHDRAVFHFLKQDDIRHAYVKILKQSLKPGAQVVIATFAPDGHESCSGLSVTRYSPQDLADALGESFALLETNPEHHRTPSGNDQSFVYCRFRLNP